MKKKTKTPKKEKEQKTRTPIYENLSKVIQQFIGGKKYVPITEKELFERLKIPPNLKAVAKSVIRDLLKEEIFSEDQGKITAKQSLGETMTGTLRVHPRGFGFVIPDHPALCPQDVFIPKHLTDNAVDGDHVEVQISPNPNSEKGPEGKVIAILKRGRTHLAGTIREVDRTGHMLAYVPLLGASKKVIVVPSENKGVKIGDRVIMKVLEWGDSDSPTRCEISHFIGNISNPAFDIPAAIEEYDLPSSFSKEALAETKKWGSEVKEKDLKKRLNLTEETIFTIDPETAKDFDDAVSINKDKKGQYHLGVHIADASYYVRPLSGLDAEASARCNSTYFPNFCLPMLPPALSDQLCSLRPKVIRLTISVHMTFDSEGTMLNYKIDRSYIKSCKRFSYEEAKLVLDGKKKSPLLKELKLMVELCQVLKKKRYQRGSIDFSLPDYVIEVDPKGEPLGVRTVEYDITHQLIEEFMLKANEVVAKHLTDRGKPVLYRIHEEPSPENLEDFFQLARTLGFDLPVKPTSQDIQRLFTTAKGTPLGQQLSVGFIRSMRLAYYSPENVGHFGLALEHYCHFTSPIRRYSDLVTHRLLFDEADENEDLKEVALRCSEQERISFKAESSVKLLKKLRLLNKMFKEDPTLVYRALITRIKPFGLFFELPEFSLEGFLHISELEDDYFLYEEEKNQLVGKHSGKKHAIGSEIKVQLVSVDFILLESKWILVHARKKRAKR